MNRPRRGFTLFETIVAIFVLLMGLMGVLAVFSGGMKARLVAQELLVSQELASMWADWIRFQLNEAKGATNPIRTLKLSDLREGANGDFCELAGDFHFGGGDPRDLPTYHKNVYRGYKWLIKNAAAFAPDWQTATSEKRRFNERLDGTAILPSAPAELLEVQLLITRGGRDYVFTYSFSGVGLKYD